MGSFQLQNIITRACLAQFRSTFWTECHNKMPFLAGWFENLPGQHFDEGKADKAVPVGEESKL